MDEDLADEEQEEEGSEGGVPQVDEEEASDNDAEKIQEEIAALDKQAEQASSLAEAKTLYKKISVLAKKASSAKKSKKKIDKNKVFSPKVAQQLDVIKHVQDLVRRSPRASSPLPLRVLLHLGPKKS